MGRRRHLWRNAGFTLTLAALVLLQAGVLLERWDRENPPPLEKIAQTGSELVDRDGRLLRAFANDAGRWRFAIKLDDVDPQFVKMLIAYEDKRFYHHPGIDPVALARAALQMLGSGRIISGASTLSMQLARLLEPRRERSFSAKFHQAVRAIQIERRLSKDEILEAYLTVAPYGGNLEGVRAASLAWFGREPGKLFLSEAALLVALPQLPELRRPDRFPEAAREARDRVLSRMASAGVIAAGEVARASLRPVPARRIALPALAPHLGDMAKSLYTDRKYIRTTLGRDIQDKLQRVAGDAARRLGQEISIAIVAADALTGEILAEVGSANYFDERRHGWIDMTRAPRSPGSTLKPFIYGLAFEEGFAAPATIISDRPANFAGYRPQNFDASFQGDVTVQSALQMSLNVPALRLLDAIGPARLAGLLRKGGMEPDLPDDENPGLALGLGGVGVTLKDLVQLYTALANDGRFVMLGDGVDGQPGGRPGTRLLDPVATWHVTDILSGVPAPISSAPREIAYKTGTSYGYRDAWSIGFDGRHVIGVWAGSADNRSIPGLTGISAAAPILFEAFAKSGLNSVPFAPPPAGALRMSTGELPAGLRRFASGRRDLVPVEGGEAPPQIVYPPAGARIELGFSTGQRVYPLVMKLQGGQAPFRLLANGAPLETRLRRRTANWLPDGRGFSTLTVIDATGRADSVEVFID